MKRGELIAIAIIIVSGVFLYIGVCRLMGYPLLSSTEKRLQFNIPLKTGHEGESLPSIEILLPDSLTYFNVRNVKKGNPVVLFYFGTNCPFCHAQMEEIIQKMNTLHKVEFYLITTNPYSEMKWFYQYFRLDRFPNVTVGVDYKFAFGTYFHTQKVPYTAVYNDKLQLNAAFTGRIRYEQLVEHIN